MSVFISWSEVDSKSHRIAKLLRDWLPKVIQRLDCFLSSKDIDAGAVWFDTLRENLERSKVGILCLTPDSTHKPWILFEAGVIARSFDQKRVYPLLVGLQPSQMPTPLAIFQGGGTTEQEMLKLVQMINDVAGEKALDAATLEDSFNLRWPAFEREAHAILKSKDPADPKPTKSPDSSALEEVLKLVRGIASGSIPVAQRSAVPVLPISEPWATEKLLLEPPQNAIDAYEQLKRIVLEKRPLISSWIGAADGVTMTSGTLTLHFSKSESFAYESLLRPVQKTWLQSIAEEIGLSGIAFRLLAGK